MKRKRPRTGDWVLFACSYGQVTKVSDRYAWVRRPDGKVLRFLHSSVWVAPKIPHTPARAT